MKKTLRFTFLIALIAFLSGNTTFAQSDIYSALPSNGSTSANARAPQGADRYNRTVWLITAAEMANSSFASGNIINSIGFNYAAAQDVATTGSLVVYLQNTADVTNTKSLTWTTAITGMTTASNSSITIPNAAGIIDYAFTGGSAFTYTGGGVYVAFEYTNAAGAIATTANVALCNTTLTAGLISARSTTAAPATLAASNWRPETRFGTPVSCARPVGLSVASTTTTSANLSWTTTSSTSDIEYGVYGYIQGAGTTVSNVTSPYVLNGLTDSTVYDYYIRSNCGGANGQSTWAGPFSFSTVFNSVTPPYTTSFEQENLPFVGWSTSGNGANDWFLNIGGTGSVLVQDGFASVVAISNATLTSSSYLFSRGINLTAGNTTTVSYYIRNYVATASTGVASYSLTYGNAPSVAAQTNAIAAESGISSTTFIQKTYSFTPATTGTYYIGFLHNSPANATGTHALILDSFSVSQVLGTNEFLASKFLIYPNPANDILTISNSENIGIKSISITDLNGRVLNSVKSNVSNQFSVNISDLSTGMYLISLDTENGTVSKKFMKN